MNPAPRLVLTGASGYLARHTIAHFQSRGWAVTSLTRHPKSPSDILWDGQTLGPWAASLENATALLNLAGRTVNCRYTARHRAEILDSRIRSTRILGEALARCTNPPPVWLNASTATIYRHAEDRPQDELTGDIGPTGTPADFSVNVATQWEKTLFDAPTPPTVRKLALRTSMVMGPGSGGPFAAFYNVAKLRAAGRLGPGTQYVSWIHINDFTRALEHLIHTPSLSGPINLTSPHPQPMTAFLSHLKKALGIRLGLPATRWMLECGAFLLRTETELLLKSRRVIPTRLLASGFTFTHPTLQTAIPDLVQKHRSH